MDLMVIAHYLPGKNLRFETAVTDVALHPQIARRWSGSLEST